MKRVYIIFVLCAVTLVSLAQKFVAEAPSQVAVGEQFRLTYTINTLDAKDFRVENIPDAFEVLMGPSTSRRSNFKKEKDKTVSTSSIIYTCILCANKAGTYDIPAASISARGKKLTSNELRVTVSGKAKKEVHNQTQRTGKRQICIPDSDLFIKVSVNKESVYEQEPILLTYKVYCSNVASLSQIDGKLPELKNFCIQNVKLPQRKLQVETVNGRQYKTVIIYQYVMFPQKAGKLKIPSIIFDCVTLQLNRNIDPFEVFFKDGSGYVEVKQKIKASSLSVDVEPLSTRPSDFSGGIGRFDISAQFDKQDVAANDSVTLRVTVSGIGNFKQMKTPAVNIPKDFDVCDTKVMDNTQITTNGMEGCFVFDFPVIPRNPGKYEIPAVEFKYFDTDNCSYKTVKSAPIILNVTKRDNSDSVRMM